MSIEARPEIAKQIQNDSLKKLISEQRTEFHPTTDTTFSPALDPISWRDIWITSQEGIAQVIQRVKSIPHRMIKATIGFTNHHKKWETADKNEFSSTHPFFD